MARFNVGASALGAVNSDTFFQEAVEKQIQTRREPHLLSCVVVREESLTDAGLFCHIG